MLIEVHRDRKGEWRWRAKRGGNVVATAHEGYTRKADAKRAWSRFFSGLVMLAMQSEPRRAPKRKGSRVT